MNIVQEEIENLIKELCELFSFEIENNSHNSYRVFTGHIDGLTLFLNLEEEDTISYYFLVRTYDVVYSGDRSDIHIVLSLMFASFLRLKTKISCSIFDIPHPVIEDEIWGRYIIPEQYENICKNRIDFIENIFLTIFEWRYFFWKLVGCPCQECMNEENKIIDENYEIDSNLKNYTTFLTRYNVGSRKRPNYTIVYFSPSLDSYYSQLS